MLLINLIGSIAGNLTGYGALTRGFWRALQAYRSDKLVCLFTEHRKPGEIERQAEKCRQFPGRVINIWLQVGPGTPVLAQFPGEKISYTMFETDTLPDGWAKGLARSDRVFTPSAWGRQVMIHAGIDPGRIHVVPGGIERTVFTPWGPRQPQFAAGTFKFLMIGAFQTRKGYPELFAAFRQAFGNRSDVELIIKADSHDNAGAIGRIQAEMGANAPRQLRTVEGSPGDAGMAALYRSCDCFVFPSRGEGFGLPLVEAMACGLPVIATPCSGHSQVLDAFAGRYFPIDVALVTVRAPDFLQWYRWRNGPGSWFEPSVDSLAGAMQRAAAGPIPWDSRAMALEVRQKFSWESSVDAALLALLA